MNSVGTYDIYFTSLKYIEMEKLIELLNKYETKTVVHWYEWYWQDVLMCRYIKDNFEFYTDEAATIAISKYYLANLYLEQQDYKVFINSKIYKQDEKY